jgi:hypothetical protein
MGSKESSFKNIESFLSREEEAIFRVGEDTGEDWRGQLGEDRRGQKLFSGMSSPHLFRF